MEREARSGGDRWAKQSSKRVAQMARGALSDRETTSNSESGLRRIGGLWRVLFADLHVVHHGL